MGLSTHILDTSIGKPASGVSIVLSKWENGQFIEAGRGVTDADGRCRSLIDEHLLDVATYKLRFATAEYYAAQHLAGLYPFVEIVFSVREPAQHYHIPLLLTANGYSTYRGS